MSKQIIWDYMKWLIANQLQDTIANFKMFQESLT